MALYSNPQCADKKEPLPQYRCAAHAPERAHRSAAQRCLQHIRHIAPSLRLFIPNSLTMCHRSFLPRFLFVTSPCGSVFPAVTILQPLSIYFSIFINVIGRNAHHMAVSRTICIIPIIIFRAGRTCLVLRG
jgi:hypothetical protein